MKKHSVIIFALFVLLASLACGPLQDMLGGDSDTGSVELPPSTGAEDLPPAQPQHACNSPAIPLAVNDTYDMEQNTTSTEYPGNCSYYCVDVPDGYSRMDIEISGFTTDLDLYVGLGGIDSVQYNDATLDENYPWRSNQFELADESVTVNSPEAGLYYMEICAYESGSSPYQMTIDLR